MFVNENENENGNRQYVGQGWRVWQSGSLGRWGRFKIDGTEMTTSTSRLFENLHSKSQYHLTRCKFKVNSYQAMLGADISSCRKIYLVFFN